MKSVVFYLLYVGGVPCNNGYLYVILDDRDVLTTMGSGRKYATFNLGELDAGYSYNLLL
jgi:hypothetical protein